jgi:RHS repeat-associated protein
MDETGNTVWQWDGEAFGNTPPNENPNGAGNFTFNLRFPGQYFDVETNLFYNYYRDYDPATGRYIESDPIGLVGGLNTYLYGDANPISRVDPLGLWGFVFNAGAHIPAMPIPGVAGGVSFSSTWAPGQGIEGASYKGMLAEAVLGEIADVGVSAGIDGLSNCTTGTPRTVSFGLGKYGGIQLNFIDSQFDGISFGIGLGVSLPVTITIPAK